MKQILHSPEITKVFLDWAIRKPFVAFVLEPNQTTPMFYSFKTLDSLIHSVKSLAVLKSQNSVIFAESGMPKGFLYRLIDSGFKVFLCDGQLVSELRGESKKTDKLDAQLLYKLYQKNPEAFREVSEPETKELKFSVLMSKYAHLTMDWIRFGHRQKAYEIEFGEKVYKEIIKKLDSERRKVLKEVEPLIEGELQKLRSIKGLGLKLIAGILSVAHPKHFPSLSRYLAYCGYKDSVGNKYNRKAKTMAYLIARSFVINQNTEFYNLYLKIKQDLKKKFPNDSKTRINNKAINRLATFALKEIYHKVREE
jgi:hypothetical protein